MSYAGNHKRNKNFNSHAHVERDENDLKFVDTKINFNSHAHVERDTKMIRCMRSMTISTHTLTWSVTSYDESAK